MRLSLQSIGERAGLLLGRGENSSDDAAIQEADGRECIVSKIGMPVLKASGINQVADRVLAEQGLISGPVAVLKHAGGTGLRLVGIGGEASPPQEPSPGELEPRD